MLAGDAMENCSGKFGLCLGHGRPSWEAWQSRSRAIGLQFVKSSLERQGIRWPLDLPSGTDAEVGRAGSEFGRYWVRGEGVRLRHQGMSSRKRIEACETVARMKPPGTCQGLAALGKGRTSPCNQKAKLFSAVNE